MVIMEQVNYVTDVVPQSSVTNVYTSVALREDEVPNLSPSMRQKLDRLFSANDCFSSGGDLTNYIAHGINLIKGHHPPATPQYSRVKEKKCSKKILIKCQKMM